MDKPGLTLWFTKAKKHTTMSQLMPFIASFNRNNALFKQTDANSNVGKGVVKLLLFVPEHKSTQLNTGN